MFFRRNGFKQHLLWATMFGCLWLGKANAQLYTQDFDVDSTASWTANPAGNDFLVSTAGDGITDFTPDYFFDYSRVGIPSAPNSTGGTTTGMKLQANVLDGEFGGGSVSPTGESFSGDYSLKFDMWSNFYLADPDDRQSNLSYGGIMTAGDVNIFPGTGDGIWFAGITDGGSGSDYRAYSGERNVSYQIPANTDIDGDMVEDSLDSIGNPIDDHATYYSDLFDETGAAAPRDGACVDVTGATAGCRNGTAWLHATTFPSVSPPLAQSTVDRETTLGDGVFGNDPDGNPDFPLQVGTTDAGDFGMAWHEVEIRKVGALVTWNVNGTTLIDVDITNFPQADDGAGNQIPFADSAGNILFGHSDFNSTVSSDPLIVDLLFTLVDNVEVTAITSSSLMCDADGDNDCEADDIAAMYAQGGGAGDFDYDGSGVIDSGDIQGWLDEASTAANLANTAGDTYVIGDVDLDGDVNSIDLGLLLNNFGTEGGTAAAGPGWGGGDLDIDGTVNSVDLGLLLNNFGFASAVAVSAVPEPASAPLMLLAAFAVVGVLRRR